MPIHKNWYISRPIFQENLESLRLYIQSKENIKINANRYRDKRGSMVVDAVTSRQRKYSSRVQGILNLYVLENHDQSLRYLVSNPLQTTKYGLRAQESQTISQVTSGLLAFGNEFGIVDENEICQSWALAVEEFRFTPGLDPYVGRVKGIGVALHSYLRKLSGADAIKPDGRVRKTLLELGFEVPTGNSSLMFLCEILAEELGIRRSDFDDLLWAS